MKSLRQALILPLWLSCSRQLIFAALVAFDLSHAAKPVQTLSECAFAHRTTERNPRAYFIPANRERRNRKQDGLHGGSGELERRVHRVLDAATRQKDGLRLDVNDTAKVVSAKMKSL